MRRAGGWVGSRLPGAAYELPGDYSHLPPISASTQNNSLFANQNIGGRVAHRRIGACNRCTGTFLSTRAIPEVRRSALDPGHNKETEDPFRCQS